jgi:hypothetical protein
MYGIKCRLFGAEDGVKPNLCGEADFAGANANLKALSLRRCAGKRSDENVQNHCAIEWKPARFWLKFMRYKFEANLMGWNPRGTDQTPEGNGLLESGHDG